MLETHLNSPVTRRRLRTGVAADHIDAFADWLHSCGYRPTSIVNGLASLAAWADWMQTAGFTAQDLLPGLEACKLAVGKEQRVRYSRGPNQQSLAAASLFIRFLRLRGELPPPVTPPSATERWPILGEFRSWMRTHRGLTETTLDVYQGILVGLLDTLGDDALAYSAETLRTFVLDRARPHGIQRAKSVVVAVRSFVRFLGVTGQCPPGMEHAIPGFASWQLSSVPRFLAAEDVERVIDSCTGYVFELRDRAVLLLLARLALRASEVAQSEIRRYRLAQRWNQRLREGPSPGIAPTAAGGRQRDSALCERRQAVVARARGVHFGTGSVSSADTGGCYPHRARSTASGRDQSAYQWRARPAALRRHYHAPSRCISGRRRCGPATPLSDDDSSLRQGGLRPPVGDRPAMAGGVPHADRPRGTLHLASPDTRLQASRPVAQPQRVRPVRRRQG